MKCLILSILAAFLVACAEQPDGVFVMNEETIENFLHEGGPKDSWNPPAQLNLLIDQPVTEASLPPIQPGLNRVYATLTSNGTYNFEDADAVIQERGATYHDSVFGMLGNAGQGGNAWFYADYNPRTGEVIEARAYLYGFMGGVCDMRKPTNETYGRVGNKNFNFTVNGPCLFPRLSGSTIEFALLVQGDGNLANAPSGKVFPIQYLVDDTGRIDTIVANPQTNPAIYDSGKGRLWENRSGK